MIKRILILISFFIVYKNHSQQNIKKEYKDGYLKLGEYLFFSTKKITERDVVNFLEVQYFSKENRNIKDIAMESTVKKTDVQWDLPTDISPQKSWNIEFRYYDYNRVLVKKTGILTIGLVDKDVSVVYDNSRFNKNYTLDFTTTSTKVYGDYTVREDGKVIRYFHDEKGNMLKKVSVSQFDSIVYIPNKFLKKFRSNSNGWELDEITSFFGDKVIVKDGEDHVLSEFYIKDDKYHGPYRSWKQGVLTSKGNYKNNEKVGLWIELIETDGMLILESDIYLSDYNIQLFDQNDEAVYGDKMIYMEDNYSKKYSARKRKIVLKRVTGEYLGFYHAKDDIIIGEFEFRYRNGAICIKGAYDVEDRLTRFKLFNKDNVLIDSKSN